MAKKIKLTRPELKRYRDMLGRFERYLPMLKLKQQQLQIAIQDVQNDRRTAWREVERAQGKFEPYKIVLADTAGVNVEVLSQPKEVVTRPGNVAGVNITEFEDITFPEAHYSLFSTPTWVDQALLDMRQINSCRVRAELLEEQYKLLQKELTKISQRVNLFEKVKIPEAKEAIRVIRIRLGDEMTAAVGRAKIAKSKLTDASGLDGRDAQASTGEVQYQ